MPVNDAETAGQVAAGQEEKDWEPRIIGFCCNWCSYAGADLAGTSRVKYPSVVRIIRVPCSGRVNPQFILRAFQRGADGVLVAGCHPGDCHYTSGNFFTRRRMQLVQRFMQFMGLEPGRLKITWISGSEGNKFAETIREIAQQVQALGPNRRMRDAI